MWFTSSASFSSLPSAWSPSLQRTVFLGCCSITLFYSGKILVSEPVSNDYYPAYQRAVCLHLFSFLIT